MFHTKTYRWTVILFVFYFIMLTWIILFKLALSPSDLPHLRTVNLIPLGDPLRVNGQADYGEVMQNLLAFVPFGIYLGLLLPGRSLVLRLLPAVLTSLAYECLQFAFMLGASDVTDLLSNTLGALVGLGVYAIFYKLCGQKTATVLNVLATLASAAMAALIVLMLMN